MKKLYAYTKLDFGYDTVYDTEVKYLADVNIPTITLPDVHSTKDT